MVPPLVQHYLGVSTVAAGTADRVADSRKSGSLGKGFSIPETKGLVGLDAVLMKSKGLDIILQVAKVGSTVC